MTVSPDRRPAEPRSLWLVRHGQSSGNVARDAAHGRPLEELDIPERDMDVPLSALGERQARAFGRWLATQAPDVRPEVVLVSPYLRAVDTARVALDASGSSLPLVKDERLRERELGVLDLLTRAGVERRFPGEHRRRERLGKFYYRPPGGESWVDVALRLRSLRDSLGREHAGRRVLLVTHEVVIVLMRYLLEGLEEESALALGGGRHANCSLTVYDSDDEGRPVLRVDGWTAPLDSQDAPVTKEPDARIASR